jgi:transcriptional regulator with AAA-type ATPase domain
MDSSFAAASGWTFDPGVIVTHLPGELSVLDLECRILAHYAPNTEPADFLRFRGRTVAEWCRARGYPDDVGARRQAAAEACMRDGTLVSFEETWRSTLGGLRHSIRSFAPVRDDSGRVEGALALGVEVPWAAGEEGAGGVAPSHQEASEREIEVLRAALRELRLSQDRLVAENHRLRSGVAPGQIGASLYEELPGLSKVREAVAGLSRRTGSVLVTGEVGTPLDWVARSVLAVDPSLTPTLEVDCATEGQELATWLSTVQPAGDASECVLLYEVAALDPQAQVALLDAVTGRDLFVVATTSRELDHETETGQLRPDLLARITSTRIEVPSLRHRSEDVAILARRLVEQAAQRLGRQIEPIGPSELARLQAYLWPGNEAELATVMLRAVSMARDHRPRILLPESVGEVAPSLPEPQAVARTVILTDEELRIRERQNLLAALSRTGWKIYGADGAAALLRVPPTTLASRIKKMRIEKPSNAERIP